ncbi:hypothetical protein MCOR25_005956 [Pyricularia grisea]|uniref:NADH:flavin oxidoreductase/NADH oxidase N-terminal domain-containing protein n=1 Tax=Pyricularia grisea TaxID=148305 RepID=A0A6P8AZR4_PYRGI|nr:hypothetical protein PgNI_11021 [Pyricularia grisea]KAI6363237.1 hypothetical protein MCOR25_005956 [Pyricularia grisea]TLD07721.1 hypothetical protein PgNI_11021 [Pyricularia grisea]
MGSAGPANPKLFEPLAIANGKHVLKHRVVHAPLTRNRGTPVNKNDSRENPNRLWLANDLIKEYYTQRATDGGLIISEGLPPCLEGGAMPGVPAIHQPAQVESWKPVTEAVHAKGSIFYAQLWHSGRAMIPQHIGGPVPAPSAVPWDDPTEVFWYPPAHTTELCKYVDYPPIEMTVEHIKRTIDDYVKAAKNALEAGFDGIEVHGGNGYLPEQFLSSNSNQRTDDYGGSPEKRCRFVLELMEALAAAIGQENLAIRLSPFGLFNQARGTQRKETWGYLCRELKARLPNLSYVSFIEPRYEQLFSEEDKQKFLDDWGMSNVDLSMFREIFAGTPFFSAGGFDAKTGKEAVENGTYDAIVYGRYFTSNPDLVRRVKEDLPFNPYNRERFYGPFEDPTIGYTDFATYDEQQKK